MIEGLHVPTCWEEQGNVVHVSRTTEVLLDMLPKGQMVPVFDWER